MVLADTWRITRGKGVCCGCGVEFRAPQAIHSGLRDDGTELARDDFCASCWDHVDPGAYFCFWRGRRAAQEPKRVVNTDLILEFFGRVDGLPPERRTVFRFVLALYLMRRKEFKLLTVSRSDGREVLTFDQRRTSERVEVESPGLTEEQIQETEAQLSRLLDVCL